MSGNVCLDGHTNTVRTDTVPTEAVNVQRLILKHQTKAAAGT